MNTAYDDGDRHNLRYAEYVLGVLDAEARAHVAREIAASDEAAASVELWHRRLAPLAVRLPEMVPSADVWARIQHALRWQATREASPSAGPWSSLRLWRWLGAGASAIAAACMVMLWVRLPRLPPPAPPGVLMVASIRQDDGIADWTATVDLDRRQIIVVPATSTPIALDRSTQLWLIPAGQPPTSMGVFKSNLVTVLPLSATLLAQLGPTATLAVSVEPAGGSPVNRPTGPVIAKGALSRAQSAG
jgi:anti-sigma-K factor RskA